MYADRPSLQQGSRTFSMGASLLITGSILAALVFVAPKVVRAPVDPALEIYEVRDKPPPPPDPDQKPQSEQVRESPPYVPPALIAIPIELPPIETTPIEPLKPPPPVLGVDKGIAETPPVVVPPPPLLPALRDPRFARDFQPPYPNDMIRQEREGKVVVRVRIGTDGRVKAVERVRSESDSFFEATKRHALAKWRFKPATRGGTPEESWQQLTVNFVLTR